MRPCRHRPRVPRVRCSSSRMPSDDPAGSAATGPRRSSTGARCPRPSAPSSASSGRTAPSGRSASTGRRSRWAARRTTSSCSPTPVSRDTTPGCRRVGGRSCSRTSAAPTAAGSTGSAWTSARSARATACRSGTPSSSSNSSRADRVDGFVLALWVVRLLFLLVIYGFLFAVVRVLMRDLRAAPKGPAELGRLVVLASPRGEPQPGASYPLDAVTTLGRDVNNGIVLDDPFASAEHAVLTYRGRSWYVEDLESTNGTFVNGVPVEGVAPLGFGDEVQVGEIRFRLDRGRA